MEDKEVCLGLGNDLGRILEVWKGRNRRNCQILFLVVVFVVVVVVVVVGYCSLIGSFVLGWWNDRTHEYLRTSGW